MEVNVFISKLISNCTVSFAYKTSIFFSIITDNIRKLFLMTDHELSKTYQYIFVFFDLHFFFIKWQIVWWIAWSAKLWRASFIWTIDIIRDFKHSFSLLKFIKNHIKWNKILDNKISSIFECRNETHQSFVNGLLNWDFNFNNFFPKCVAWCQFWHWCHLLRILFLSNDFLALCFELKSFNFDLKSRIILNKFIELSLWKLFKFRIFYLGINKCEW